MEICSGVYFYRGRAGDRMRRGAGSCNVVVLKGETLRVVDSGVCAGGAFRDLRERIASDGLALQALEWIVHTHGHWDHINADGEMVSLSGAKIAAGEGDVPLVENPEEYFREGLGEFTREVFPFPEVLVRFLIQWIFGKQPRLRVDRALRDGDVIDPEGSITAVALPGHTQGHVGFFLPGEGVLISGDLFDFENAHGMDINNPLSDYGEALASLEKAMRLEPEIVIPGHGEPTRGVTEVKRVLERAHASGVRYPERIRKALGGGAMRLKAVTYKVFPDTLYAMEAMNMMLVLTVLFHMEGEGVVVRAADRRGRPVWAEGEAG